MANDNLIFGIQEWAMREAFNRSDVLWHSDNPKKFVKSMCELARMIEKHEKPPVTRELLCAREATVNVLGSPDYGSGNYDKSDLLRIALRAIQLFQEGFGDGA